MKEAIFDKRKFISSIDFESLKDDPTKYTVNTRLLLWEIDLNQFDFQKGRILVIERVIQRGDLNDWYAIFQLYGINTIRNTIKEIIGLSYRDMETVCEKFNIPITELKSWQKKEHLKSIGALIWDY